MAKEEEKVSFSFSSKSSSSVKRRNLQPFDQDPAVNADSDTHFVTEFDSSKTLASSSAASNPVIAPIPNNDFRKRMKNLPIPESSEPSDGTRFVVAESDPAAATDNVSYGLTLRSNPNPNRDKDPTPKQEDLTLKRFKEDMQTLPDDRGMDEFKDIAVEDFGVAVLAGYGWKKGEGIGRNKNAEVKVVEYERRAGTVGIGYDPKKHDGIVKVKTGRGSVYKVNESKDREPAKRVVRIVSGVHIGKKGEILKRTDASTVVLKLANSGEEVRVDEDRIAELGSEAEERCLKKLKELEDFERKEKSGKRREKYDKRGHGSDRRSTVRWLKSHIRVRIISEKFKGGKWYEKKGEVVDVVGPTTCDILMDGTKELIQGVDQDILETVLPKRDGSVVVLYGRHKGVYGKLEKKDNHEETGLVRDADSHELINVRLDQIAEYVGDPSYLGYES